MWRFSQACCSSTMSFPGFSSLPFPLLISVGGGFPSGKGSPVFAVVFHHHMTFLFLYISKLRSLPHVDVSILCFVSFFLCRVCFLALPICPYLPFSWGTRFTFSLFYICIPFCLVLFGTLFCLLCLWCSLTMLGSPVCFLSFLSVEWWGSGCT